MVVCKYFLQGTCKFGDFCKFDHQIDNFNSIQNASGNTSILRQAHFSTSQQPQLPKSTTSVDSSTLIKSVINDMTGVEKGGQWLLSCYAPFKEKPAFPGFEDQSFEEIRLGYYEAIKSGNVEQYKQQINMMLQQQMLKIKALQAPSPDVVNMLIAIYNTPPSSHAGVYGSSTTMTSAISNSTNPSIFGQQQPISYGTQPGSSIFSQANQALFQKPSQPQQSNFGQTSIFGSVPQNQNNMFGNQTQVQSTNKNIFGQPNSPLMGGGTLFGGQQTTTQPLIFNTGQNNSNLMFNSQQSNPLMSQTVQQNTSLFGTQSQQTGIFGNQTNPTFEQSNIFKTQTIGASVVSQGNIFPSVSQSNAPFVPTTNAFLTGQAQNFGPTSLFNHPSGPANIFTQQNQQQTTNSPLGQQSKNILDASSHTSNIFGVPIPAGKAEMVRTQMEPPDPNIYSKLQDLREEEIKWFESDDLDITNIPEKPPTYEMCFKT